MKSVHIWTFIYLLCQGAFGLKPGTDSLPEGPSGLKFDPGDEWPEGIRVLRKLAKRDTDDNDRRRLKTKFVGDVEVVVKGTQCRKTRKSLSTMLESS